MKIVQTFWTGPAGNQAPLAIKAGWLSAEYHWMAWALSCLQLQKIYGAVTLVTDNLGKSVLVDQLKLPYAQVSTALEGSLAGYPPELWSLAKISAFAAQQEPFLHFDGDCFIWQRLGLELEGAGIVAQNLEENLSYYRDMMADMEQKGWQMPPLLQGVGKAPTIYAANTGIFGGHDLAFVQQYCRAAFDFVDGNRAIIPLTQKNQLNFIFEQCLLYYMAAAQGKPIAYVMEEPVTEPHYNDYARFVDVPQVPLIHTVGGYKTMPYTCSHLARRLRNDFPEWYYRIVGLCAPMGLHNQCYRVPPFDQPDFYPQHYGPLMQSFAEGELLPSPTDAQPMLSAATGPAFADAFARTLCAVPGHNSYATLQQAVGATDGPLGQLAAELLDLETRCFLMQAQMADPAFLQHLYCMGAGQYKVIDHLFAGPEPLLLAAFVQLNGDAQLLQYTYDLNFDPSDAAVVAELLQEEPAGTQVLLLPDAENGATAELYPDTMDAVVMHSCQQPLHMVGLLEEMKQYFDADELANGYDDYKKLIFDTVKQLLLNGWLSIVGK
jgi:hypothetical protein